MTSGQIKGALLELIVRRLMINCGFTSVKPDGHYIFAQLGDGLFFINGKGAAHDADVLMEPPIQIPFSYPSRLLFECKSYDKSIGLNVIRNGLGLRYDINEFEIVTDETIELRKNNHRASYAISNRKRYHYQVGIASVEEFSKSAFEFAANNKIPLLSLRWFLRPKTCDLFRTINAAYVDRIPDVIRRALYKYLKDKNPAADLNAEYNSLRVFLREDQTIGRILRDFQRVITDFAIGLLETGDLIFLFSKRDNAAAFFREQFYFNELVARLHYPDRDRSLWTLEIRNFRDASNNSYSFDFYVPERIMRQWRSFNYDRSVGYTLKGEFFSKIFIFSSGVNNNGLPFTMVNLDSEWLDDLLNRE